MKDYLAKNIRNLSIIGHGSVGKTTLAEPSGAQLAPENFTHSILSESCSPDSVSITRISTQSEPAEATE